MTAEQNVWHHNRVHLILASKRNGALYVGVTSDLPRRIFEHKEGLVEGFTKSHDVNILVYVEAHDAMEMAIRQGDKRRP